MRFRNSATGSHLLLCIPLVFAGEACFRDNKAAYQAVSNKRELLQAWDTRTEFVRETHLCPDYQRRRPHAGYRGGFPEP